MRVSIRSVEGPKAEFPLFTRTSWASSPSTCSLPALSSDFNLITAQLGVCETNLAILTLCSFMAAARLRIQPRECLRIFGVSKQFHQCLSSSIRALGELVETSCPPGLILPTLMTARTGGIVREFVAVWARSILDSYLRVSFCPIEKLLDGGGGRQSGRKPLNMFAGKDWDENVEWRESRAEIERRTRGNSRIDPFRSTFGPSSDHGSLPAAGTRRCK